MEKRSSKVLYKESKHMYDYNILADHVKDAVKAYFKVHTEKDFVEITVNGHKVISRIENTPKGTFYYADYIYNNYKVKLMFE